MVRLVRGAPVKVRPGDRHALLGEMLVEAGAIDAATLESALATKGLLGDMLLVAGRVDGDVLEAIAEQQFVRRMVRLFSLPPATAYRYFDGHDELAEYGGDPASVDPLTLLWAGLRDHGELSTMMPGTLALLGDAPIRLHAAATVSRFGCTDQEAKLVEHLCTRSASLVELEALGHVPPEGVRRFAYALMITRQIDLGTGTTPLGAGRPPLPPPGSAPRGTPRAPAPTGCARRRRGADEDPLHGAPRRRGGARFAGRRRARSREPRRPPGARRGGRSSESFLPASRPEALARAPCLGRGAGDAAIVLGHARGGGPAPAARGRRAQAGQRRDARRARAPRGAHAPLAGRPGGRSACARRAGSARGALARRSRRAGAGSALGADPRGAIAACEAARKAAPGDPDVIALESWARSQLGGADLKALTVALDEVLNEHEAHVEARFYRALLRKRLGDEGGATRDLRRVLELEPGHEGAIRELAAIETKQKAKERPSLFGRLFKR